MFSFPCLSWLLTKHAEQISVVTISPQTRPAAFNQGRSGHKLVIGNLFARDPWIWCLLESTAPQPESKASFKRRSGDFRCAEYVFVSIPRTFCARASHHVSFTGATDGSAGTPTSRVMPAFTEARNASSASTAESGECCVHETCFDQTFILLTPC